MSDFEQGYMAGYEDGVRLAAGEWEQTSEHVWEKKDTIALTNSTVYTRWESGTEPSDEGRYVWSSMAVDPSADNYLEYRKGFADTLEQAQAAADAAWQQSPSESESPSDGEWVILTPETWDGTGYYDYGYSRQRHGPYATKDEAEAAFQTMLQQAAAEAGEEYDYWGWEDEYPYGVTTAEDADQIEAEFEAEL